MSAVHHQEQSVNHTNHQRDAQVATGLKSCPSLVERQHNKRKVLRCSDEATVVVLRLNPATSQRGAIGVVVREVGKTCHEGLVHSDSSFVICFPHGLSLRPLVLAKEVLPDDTPRRSVGWIVFRRPI